MTTVRGVKDRRFEFVQLLNSMFEDPKLSLKAKGFIGYCLTKPKDWKFHINHLCKVLKEGEKALYSVIKECIDNGYSYRYQPRGKEGEFLPIEIIVSDSKYEIDQIKEEIELEPTFKKCLPLACFGDAVDGDADNAPISNKESSNIVLEQQQSAAVPKKVEERKPGVYSCLMDLEVSIRVKQQVTKKHTLEQVEHALKWLQNNDKPLHRGLAAALIWACDAQPEIHEPKETPYEKVKKLFTNGMIYNGAECYLNSDRIAFVRNTKDEFVKLDQYFTWKKLVNLCEIFGIPCRHLT